MKFKYINEFRQTLSLHLQRPPERIAMQAMQRPKCKTCKTQDVSMILLVPGYEFGCIMQQNAPNFKQFAAEQISACVVFTMQNHIPTSTES